MKATIEIPVADLKSVLPGLSKIIPKKSGLPVLGCVKITLNPDRTLHLQANNLDQMVTARLNKSFNGKPGEMLVPYEELAGMAKHCSATDTIELSVEDKETSITYPAAGTRIRKPVAYLEVDEFPPETVVSAEPVKLDEAFKVALHQALDCASDDSGHYVLRGACLDVSNKEAHYVVGSNGRHLFSANSFLFDVPQSIIIPQGKFLIWAGFVEDGPWTLRFQPGTPPKAKSPGESPWIRLDSEHWTYVSRPIEGEYPHWKQAVPKAAALQSHIILGEPGVKKILEALPLLPGQGDVNQPVSLDIKGEYLILKAQGKNDWTEIPIPAQVSGLPVTVALNRTYLAKALKFGCTQIDIQSKSTPMLFSAKGRTLVVCPLGMEEETKDVPIAPAAPSDTGGATPPSAEPPPTKPTLERTQPMPEPNGAAAITSGPLTSPPAEAQETPAIDLMAGQLATVREDARQILEDLSSLERLLRQAVKAQRSTDKDLNRARTTLRSLQSVEL